MKTRIKSYGLLFLCSISLHTYSQSSISGPSTVSVGATSRYEITAQSLALINWSVSFGGTVTQTGSYPAFQEVSSNVGSVQGRAPIEELPRTYYADILWNSSGNKTVSVEGSVTANKSVSVLTSGGGSSSDSPWTESNGEVYYSGNVGIGLTNPSSRLHVSGNTNINGNVDANYFDVKSGNGRGIRFWNSNNYKIHMGNVSENHYGPVQDYSIKMNMNNDSDRGWTWGVVGATPIAAISTQGHMQIKGNFTSEGSIYINTLARNDNQNKVLVANSSGKILWRDASTLSGGSSLWTENSNGANYDGDAVVTGSFETWGGDVAAYNGAIIGREFITESMNNNSINVPMNIYTERGDMRFEIDREGDSPYNGYYWNDNGNLLMSLAPSGLVVGGTAPPGNPREKLEIVSGTIRIHDLAPEPSNLAKLLSIDDTGKFFWKDASSITGSIDPTENIDFEGVITIGTPSLSGAPTGQFYVNGPSYFTEINVEVGPWPDYVFLPDYKLRPLEEVYQFIKINGHLPDVPSAKEVEQEGINVAEMNSILLQKIEELTLYQVQLLDMLKKQQAEINALKTQQK